MDLHGIARILSMSIALEASATPKPGNVHRLRDLPGLKYEDFLVTSIMSYKYLLRGVRRGYYPRGYRVLVGDIIYYTLRDTMEFTGRGNTCLGSMLLLAPLSVIVGYIAGRHGGVNRVELVRNYTGRILRAATIYDTILFYKAVRLAKPTYIKPTDKTDGYVNVWDPRYRAEIIRRRQSFYSTIKYSSSRDLNSQELYEGYPRSLEASMYLEERLKHHGDWNRGVVETYLYLLSRNVDTTITRTHGLEIAGWVSREAGRVLDRVLGINNDEWVRYVDLFDRELRFRGVNPGSVADLVVSSIALYLLRNLRLY